VEDEMAKNNAIDGFGRKKSIDDFKGTYAHKVHKTLCENSARARKGKSPLPMPEKPKQ
jgi:hypothetical protein